MGVPGGTPADALKPVDERGLTMLRLRVGLSGSGDFIGHLDEVWRVRGLSFPSSVC